MFIYDCLHLGSFLHFLTHAWSHDHIHPIKWMGNYLTGKKTCKRHIPTI